MAAIRIENKNSVKDSEIKSFLSKFNSETGSFTDINYADNNYSNWETISHVTRIKEFIFAYTNKESSYFSKDEMYNNIVKGLQFWYSKNPTAPNWWYNQINEPQILGISLIWMRKGAKQIPEDLEKKTLDRIRKDGEDPDKKTGANRTDVALHWIYRSCLQENKKDLEHAFVSVFKTLDLTKDEGIQHDYSFFQHGAQIYFGGYGHEFLKGVTLIGSYALGTPFALSGERLDNLSTFMCEGFYKVQRGGLLPFGVLGRSVSRPNGISERGSGAFAQRMLKIDPSRAAEFQKIIDRLSGKGIDYGIVPSHTHYFRADYTLHVRPKYTFDVRMTSKFTETCENGNGENLKGYFISDGSTNILVNGDEYLDIFPTWNWAQIPGTTAPQVTKIPKTEQQWGIPGESPYAGGVSDGTYGASGYSYFDEFENVNTGANKSWFFFDEEVVCLGNVQSTSGNKVKTTINQCLGKNKIVTIHNGQSESSLGNTKTNLENPRWIHHNNIGYVFPKGGNVWVSNIMQSGSWYDINNNKSKNTIKNNVFALGFDYGSLSDFTPYAYIVLPAVTSPSDVEAYAKKDAVTILNNDFKVQAVYHNDLKLLQSVFFIRGTIEHNDLTISVDKACIIMLKETEKGKYTVYVADPRRSQGVIELTFKNSENVTKKITANFKGTGNYAGKTKEYTLTF